jgi:FkbM family methyltransferase
MFDAMSKLLSRLPAYLPSSLSDWILKKSHSIPALKWLTGRLAPLLRNQEVEITGGVGKGLLIDVGDSAAAYVLGNFKPELQAFLSSNIKAGSVFYDVGANVGFFSLIAARLVGPSGSVVCFEPLPANLLKLEENTKRNGFANVQILPLALGAANEERTFQVSERPTWGKFQGVGLETPNKYLFDTKVAVRRLDDLVNEGAIAPPQFVKIDVEGAEVEVIEGARETLLHHGPALMIELHGTAEPLIRIFSAIGYCAFPLKSEFENVIQAHWNAMILAFPADRLENIVSAQKLIHFA